MTRRKNIPIYFFIIEYLSFFLTDIGITKLKFAKYRGFVIYYYLLLKFEVSQYQILRYEMYYYR